MKSLKKSLVFLVVLTIVLSTVAPVFAAAPADVVGTDYEEAVGKLVTLGVIAGYEDGTFQPEKNITRAEFAKIACYVVGVKDAAELSKGTTKFSDVPATHWASGFINIASEKGMLKGYPDGTFKPEANVTYAEAITILVRALGMGPVCEGKGTWPANYLSRAAAAGVTENVAGLASTGAAVRGVIAQLAWNTLTSEMWGESEYTVDGVVYAPLGKELIKSVYGDYAYVKDSKYYAKEFNGVRVVGTQLAGGLNNDQLRLKVSDSSDLKALVGTNNEAATEQVLKVTDAVKAEVNLNTLFGKKVDVLLGKDNKIAYIKAQTADAVEGLVEADDYDAEEGTVKVSGKDYYLKPDAKLYLNGYPYTEDSFGDMVAAIENSTTNVTAVLDSGRILYASIFAADAIDVDGAEDDVAVTQGVVKEIKSNGEVKDLNGTTMFDLDTVTADTKTAVFIKNGKPATSKDLKVGDAVTYVDGGTLFSVVMSDVKVTGKVTKVASDEVGNGDNDSKAGDDMRRKLTVDGKEYKMVNDGTVLMSKTGDVDDANPVDETAADFSGKEATLTLNALGEVVYVSGEVKTSATMQVGIVTKDLTDATDGYNIKIMTPAGVATTYVVTGDKYYVLDAADTELSDNNERDFDNLGDGGDDSLLAKGAVVAYDVSSDGKIKGTNLYVLQGNSIDDGDLKVLHLDPSSEITDVKDSSMKLTVEMGDADLADLYDGNYYCDASTTYVNTTLGNIEKIDGWDSIVTSDDVAESSFAGAVDTYLVLDKDDDNLVKTMLIDAAAYTSSAFNYGVYVDADSDSSDDFITLYVDGASIRYTATDSIDTNYSTGDLVQFKLDGEGKFDIDTDSMRADRSALNDLVEDETDSDEDGTVDSDVYKVNKYDATNRLVTFKAGTQRFVEATDLEEDAVTTTNVKSVRLASDAVVYNVSTKGEVKVGSLSDIAKGKYLTVDDYNEDDDNYSVVVIFNE